MSNSNTILYGRGSAALSNVVNLSDYARKSSPSILEARRQAFQFEMLEMNAEAASQGLMADPNSLAEAFDFVDTLDLRTTMPCATVEPDGKIMLEWVKRENDGKITMFSVIFDDGNLVFSSMTRGQPGSRGVLNMCGESRKDLQNKISALFATSNAIARAV